MDTSGVHIHFPKREREPGASAAAQREQVLTSASLRRPRQPRGRGAGSREGRHVARTLVEERAGAVAAGHESHRGRGRIGGAAPRARGRAGGGVAGGVPQSVGLGGEGRGAALGGRPGRVGAGGGHHEGVAGRPEQAREGGQVQGPPARPGALQAQRRECRAFRAAEACRPPGAPRTDLDINSLTCGESGGAPGSSNG